MLHFLTGLSIVPSPTWMAVPLAENCIALQVKNLSILAITSIHSHTCSPLPLTAFPQHIHFILWREHYRFLPCSSTSSSDSPFNRLYTSFVLCLLLRLALHLPTLCHPFCHRRLYLRRASSLLDYTFGHTSHASMARSIETTPKYWGGSKPTFRKRKHDDDDQSDNKRSK